MSFKLATWSVCANSKNCGSACHSFWKFNAHKLFIESMLSRLDKIPPSPLKPTVERVFQELDVDLKIFSGLDEAMQTFEAKALAKRMALAFESVVALEMAESMGEHCVLLADIYLETTWGLRKLGDPRKTAKLFE